MKISRTRPILTVAIAAAAFVGGLATQAQADQPFMHSALDQLRSARASLDSAVPDKGGHRVRAMAFVDRAIAEVRAGIGFERAN